jgi:hypothetical protein
VVKYEKFRILHNEELSHLYSSPGIVRVVCIHHLVLVKPGSFELTGYVVNMHETRK